MRSKSIILSLSALALLCSCGQEVPQLGKSKLDKVVAAMTLEEKASMVVGCGRAGQTQLVPGTPAYEAAQNEAEFGTIGQTQYLVPGAAGITRQIDRLGIPSVVLADGPAGLRISPKREGDSLNTYYCTHFPIGTLLASTWDQELVEEVGKSIGNEVHEYGVDVLLAPGMNIHRNPLCGRNFEYYSEDPVVTGKIAAAYVRGIQSNDVGTSIKHFAVNSQETNRKGDDAIVSQRALREIYLRGFEIAIKESDPWTVMSSYNLANGVYTSENPELLTTVLRDEWGYKGMVMTDWNSGANFTAQVHAGNDLIEPGHTEQMEAIIAAVKSGELAEADLDRNVKKILGLVLRSPRFKGYQYSDKPDLKAHAAVTRQSATEGMVLLKNDDGVLPLASDIKKVAVLGATSYDFIAGGTGSGNVNRAYTVSLLEGLQGAGYEIDSEIQGIYETYIAAEKEKNAPPPGAGAWAFLFSRNVEEMPVPVAKLSSFAASNDVALITIGRNSGEGADRKTDNFNLKPVEQDLIAKTCEAFHAVGKKVVVVLNIGGVIETASWKEKPDAILLAWQGGQEGGNSVTDVLKGVASPSGKLPMTFPVDVYDHPSSSNFPIDLTLERGAAPSGRPNVDVTLYEEDIYVGYRYFDSFGVEVSYPFGYGLTYTSFEYGNAAISKKGDTFTVTVDVKNVGSVPGKEVVQLYAAAPDSKALNKPEKELKAFAKTSELQPGETQTLSLSVKVSDLASFNESASAWITDAGSYNFLIGASSRDIKATLAADVPAWSQSVHNVLAPSQPLNRLSR